MPDSFHADRPVQQDRDDRLAAIRRYRLGEGVHDGIFDGLVELAAEVCGCRVGLVSIVREDDQFFEAASGTALSGTPLSSSICSHAILQRELFEIPDTRLDPRTRDMSLTIEGDVPVRFYAGAPISTRQGVPLGTVCVLDPEPRALTDGQRRALITLAGQVMQLLELREVVHHQDAMRREVDHRVKNSLANVAAMTRMAARGALPEVREALGEVERRINVMVELHIDLYRAADPEAPVEVSGFLTRIASHLEGMMPPGVEIQVRLEPLSLVARRASALGVMVNEMLSNACKHAFPQEATGTIALEGQVGREGRYTLVCRDDGVGNKAVGAGQGLGHRIMEASAMQLDGFLKVLPGDAGWRTELEFPLNPAA